MIAPKVPNNERERQQAVEKYNLLDTLPEESYDNITSIMSFICDTPISLITLLDKERNFLKSHHGIPFNESPRELSFCGHAINSEEEITIVADARNDDRFFDNPLVTEHEAIFYAGVPLVNPQGYKLGTLCVYDHQPKKLTTAQTNALKAMAKQMVQLFEQHYQNKQLLALQASLELRNENLKKFANLISHDLKSPVANIDSLITLIKESNEGKLDKDTKQYLEMLKQSSQSLRNYIEGLLAYYKTDHLKEASKEEVSFFEIKGMLSGMLSSYKNIEICYPEKDHTLYVNKMALYQVLVNLLVNAIKYSSPLGAKITLTLREDNSFYYFSVIDNGVGIAAKHLETIFKLFEITGQRDYAGNLGSGIGLATVKRIVEAQGGIISVTSTVGEGSNFSFTFSK